MELEAYRTQYRYCVENHSRNYRRHVLRHCSEALSGRLYGTVMSYDEAYEAIMNSDHNQH